MKEPDRIASGGKWLAAYRAGRWRQDPVNLGHNLAPGEWIEWTSPFWGSCAGQILLIGSQGWVVVAGAHVPEGLAWIREELVYG